MSIFSKSYKIKDLHFGTDVHSHLLPGVDDGFRNSEDSETAIKMLHDLGFDHFMFTPHIYPELYPANSPSFIRERFAEVQQRFDALGVECKVAGEHMVYEGFEDYVEENRSEILAFPQGEILIEMSYAFISPNIREAVFYLNSVGLKPVLAHPERYLFYSSDLHEIKSLASLDCKMQLNLLSLSGSYGRTAKAKAEAILEAGLYDYAGTDLHSVAQIPAFSNIRISKKQLKAVEKIIEGNSELLKNL